MNKRPRRKQRGIATLFLTFHAPQGAGNLPVILLKYNPIILIKKATFSPLLLQFSDTLQTGQNHETFNCML